MSNKNYLVIGCEPEPLNRLLQVTLQGIVNRQGPRLYLLRDEETDGHWVEWYGNYGLEPEEGNTAAALDRFLPETNGAYVLPEDEEEWDVPLAVTLAGIRDRVIVTPDQAGMVEDRGGAVEALPVPEFGTRLEAMAWAKNNLRPKTNPEVLHANAWHVETYNVDIVDWVVARRGFSFRLTTHPTHRPGERELLGEIYDESPMYSHVLGWHLKDKETSHVLYAGEYGLVPFCMTRNLNFSFHRHVESRSDLTQKGEVHGRELRSDKCYVTVVFSDGDAPHSMVDLQKRQWIRPERGEFPFGWAVPPQMLTFGPAMLDYYYESMTPEDELLCGPSGLGYNYLSTWAIRRSDVDDAREARLDFLRRTNELMERLDLHAMWPINRMLEWLPDGRMLRRIAGEDVWALNADTAPGTYGVDYMDDSVIRDYCTHVPCSRGFFQGWHNIPHESERVYEGRPYFPGKVMGGDPEQTVRDIEYHRAIEDAPAFVPVHVNCYKMDLGDVQEAVSSLGDEYEVITPSEFLKLAAAKDGQ
ncbi:MAG: GxGYxYP domain-containing protein [Candidatus Brocadiia bacterium]